MGLRHLWRYVRAYIPVSLYPLLAIPYQWNRKAVLRKLEHDDVAYLASHPALRIPAAELRFNVVDECAIPAFLESGRKTAQDIEEGLRRAG